MRSPDILETSLYQQKLAHKTWVDKVTSRGFPPTAQQSELVWELIVAYGEALDDFAKVREDLYKTAHELAGLLLPEMPMKRIWGLYRDRLVQTVKESGIVGADESSNLLAFANTLSSAYAEAQADILKKRSLASRAESIERELKVAKRIQEHLLPKTVPNIPGYEFAGGLFAAGDIGGDYWSIKYQKKDDIVTLKLADITGHGVAAATLVAAVKFISGGYYRGARSAAEVIEKTNVDLATETPHEILISMVYGWLKTATRELTLVNAGHAPVYLCRQGICEEVPLTGPVLGVSEDAAYEELHYQLHKNDIVFFGSDGITEAGIVHPFGAHRLKRVIEKSASLSAMQIADRVVKEVAKHLKKTVEDDTEALPEERPKPHDDISLVVVKVTGDAPEAG